MSRFSVEGEGLDPLALLTEIERRAGPELASPPSVAAAEPPPDPTDLFGRLLRSLSENADAAQGFPPQSHRSFGGAVVAAKRGFRMAFQPFINEALARQRGFNQRLLDALAALRSEQLRLESRLEALERKARPGRGRGRRAPARAPRGRS